jgi:transcriptional regulator with XRE-family HTH domain
MDLRRTFARNVFRLRSSKGISQEELAHLAGINRSHVSDIETCKTYAGLEIIGKIADVLGVEGADLLKKSAKRPAKTK